VGGFGPGQVAGRQTLALSTLGELEVSKPPPIAIGLYFSWELFAAQRSGHTASLQADLFALQPAI